MTNYLEIDGQPSRSAKSPARMLGLAIFGLLVITGLTDTEGLNAAPLRTAADTVPAEVPAHFRKTVFFDTPYLTRAAEAALERYRASASESAVDSTSVRAATYAKRYGITRDLAKKIIDTALAEGLDPELGFRLIRVESVFDVNAVGRSGSLGLTQLMPSTARAVDRSLRTRSDILEPTKNLRVGFRYLRQMIERYDGDVRLGLLAYNRGEGAVDRALKRGKDPENGYSHLILGTKGKSPYKNSPYKGAGLIAKKKSSKKSD